MATRDKNGALHSEKNGQFVSGGEDRRIIMEIKIRDKRNMTFEEYVNTIKKESAELAVAKAYPEDYQKEIARWEKEDAVEDYRESRTVDECVYFIRLMI